MQDAETLYKTHLSFNPKPKIEEQACIRLRSIGPKMNKTSTGTEGKHEVSALWPAWHFLAWHFTPIIHVKLQGASFSYPNTSISCHVGHISMPCPASSCRSPKEPVWLPCSILQISHRPQGTSNGRDTYA